MKKEVFRGLASIFSFFLIIIIMAMPVAETYSGRINTVLGVSTSKIVSDDNTSSVDTVYYTSDYGNDIYDEAQLLQLENDAAKESVIEQEEGSVLLLNNDNALPIEKDISVTLFGQSSIEHISLGASSGDFGGTVDGPFYTYHSTSNGMLELVPYVDAMKSVFNVNETLLDAYEVSEYQRVKDASDPEIGEAPSSFYTDDIKESWQIDYNDAAIIMLTRQASEDCDLVTETSEGISQLALCQDEIDLLMMIQNEKEAGVFDKVIVLINSNWAMELGELESYGVDSVLWIGSPGVVGFTGVANLLVGDATPSGKLVDIYATNSLSAPANTYAQMNVCTWENLDEVLEACTDSDKYISYYMIYAEGIYVGYKYYETRYEDVVLGQGNASSLVGSTSSNSWSYHEEIVYPFGYGLSYTTFDQVIDTVDYNEILDIYTISVTVTNTGSYSGKSVVEVYSQTPYGDYEIENKVEKASVNLVGFGKTDELQPGSSETVLVEVDGYLLASYDYSDAEGYILSEGDYYLAIGDDAHEALNNILEAKGATGLTNINGNLVVGNLDQVYQWTQEELDTITYRYSDYTSNPVTNIFDDADINNLETDTITYLSRNDWEGTYPVEHISVTATAEMITDLDNDTYEKFVDSLSASDFSQGVDSGIMFVDMKDVSYDDDYTWDLFLNQLTIEEMCSILVDQNGSDAIESINMLSTYRGDDMDCLEQVTFKATGNSGISWNSTVVMTSTWNTERISERTRYTANEAYFMGCTEIWSGGPNLHRTPFNGRASAYYSEDGNLGYLVGAIIAEKVQEYGVILGLKHLAVNDQEAHRESIATFTNEQALREIYLRAFEGAYCLGGAQGCMTAFNRLGTTYCGSSDELMTSLLDDEWEYTGHITSDAVVAMDYKTHYAENIIAGIDYFCWDMASFGGPPGEDNEEKAKAETVLVSKDVIYNMITENDDGDLLHALRSSTKDTVYAQVHSILINGLSSDTKIVYVQPWWESLLQILLVGFAILTFASISLYYITLVRKKSDNVGGGKA